MSPNLKKSLIVPISILCISALTLVSLAWFAGVLNPGSLGFKTGSNASEPKLVVWMYTATGDVEAGETVSSDSWESAIGGADTVNHAYVTIPGIQTTTKDGKTTVVQKSLHFGKVDNLVTLNPDNKIYLRFEFSMEKDGGDNFLALTLNYNTAGYEYGYTGPGMTPKDITSVFDSIYLYQDADHRIPLELPANYEEIESIYNNDPQATLPEEIYVLEFNEDNPAAMQFLQLRYAVSTEALGPNDAGFADLEFSDSLPINCGSNNADHSTETEAETDTDGNPVKAPVCRDCRNNTCGHYKLNNPLEDLTFDPNDEVKTYYLYVELAPILEAFGMQENILDYFVPAYMFFDVKLDVEIG